MGGDGFDQAALESLVRYFAVALGPRGITVNAISPEFVTGQTLHVDGGASIMDPLAPLLVQQG